MININLLKILIFSIYYILSKIIIFKNTVNNNNRINSNNSNNRINNNNNKNKKEINNNINRKIR